MLKGKVSIAIATVLLIMGAFGVLATAPAGGTYSLDPGAVNSLGSSDRTYFIQNDGQWDTDMDYAGTTSIGPIGFSSEGVFINIVEEVEEEDEDIYFTGHILKLSFVDARSVTPEGVGMMEGKMNYLIGPESRWSRNVPIFSTVEYRNLWNGIDLRYTYGEDGLKYEFIVAPFSDPSDIKVKMEGQRDLEVEDGRLVISVKEGIEILDQDLKMWYDDGSFEEVTGEIYLVDDDVYSFDLDDYDPARGLVIDPLYFSTFLGGYGTDYAYSVAADNKGCSYVTGYTTYSSSGEFPTTSGAYQRYRASTSYDVFVTKFNYKGSEVVYSTFIGGYGSDYGYGIDVDSDGYAYITGYTYYASDSNTYPTTSGAYKRSIGGYPYYYSEEVFVTKFAKDGSYLEYSTYLGGVSYDYAYDIAVDDDGNAYVTGRTYYDYYYVYYYGYSDFPTTSDAYQGSRPYLYNYQYDAFATVFNSAGSALLYSTFLGGDYGTDTGYGIAVNESGEFAVVGDTAMSYNYEFPVTSGAYQTSRKSTSTEAFVACFDADYSINYVTFLGGYGTDYGKGIDFDSKGRVVVAGYTTYSSSGEFPTTSGAYQTSRSSTSYDAFVTKFRYHGTALAWSTFLGGTSSEYVDYDTLKIGGNDRVYVAGRTYSTNFPTANAYKSSISGSFDMFLTNLSADGSSLGYSTYFGGGYYEYAYGLDVDKFNNIFVTGYAPYSSSYTDFPTTSGAYQTSRKGTSYDVVLFKYGIDFADNVAPVLGTDSSDASAYTGQSFKFETAITDNVGVWEAYVEYWFGSGSHSNKSLRLLEPFSTTITVPNSLDTMYYFFSAADYHGNWVSGSTKSRTPIDVSGPEFSNIGFNPNPPTTGESVNVTVDVIDNVQVQSGTPRIHYRSSWDSSYTSMTMTYISGDQYSAVFTVGTDWTGMYYYFDGYDTANNYAMSSTYYRSITDNDAPGFVADGSDTSGTTGDPFTFNITMKDNVGISYAYVEYWFGSSPSHSVQSLSISGTGRGSDQVGRRTITLPYYSDDDMTYFYHFRDAYSNWWTSGPSSNVTVTISDNDAPEVWDVQWWDAYTGDPFYFSIMIYDNIDGYEVDSAYVLWSYDEDWGNAVNLSLSYNSDDSTWDSASFSVNLYSLDPITYYIQAVDANGNWLDLGVWYTYVYDNDDPEFKSEQSQSVATTGDPFVFNLTVEDNIAIDMVYVHYWYTDMSYEDILWMDPDGSGSYIATADIMHTLTPFDYEFEFYDTSWNYDMSPQTYTRTPVDNDLPDIFNDMSQLSGEAGKDYMFRVMIKDNIALKPNTLFLNYGYGAGSPTQVALNRITGNIYGYDITLINQAGAMTYTFQAEDSSGNVHVTPQVTIDILDITPPSLDDLSFPTTATTGDEYIVTIEATDDVGLQYVRMYYYYGDMMPQMMDHVNGVANGDDYTFTLNIPDTLDALHFGISASDDQGNMQEIPFITVPVIDNDMPLMISDMTPGEGTTGDPLEFKVDVSDNIDIYEVRVHLTFPDDTIYVETLTSGDEVYHLTVSLPDDQKGALTYMFEMIDTSMNTAFTDEAEVIIEDDSPPIPLIIVPTTIMQHEEVTLDGSGSTDNVGIVNWTWQVEGALLYGDMVAYVFDDVGTFIVTLTVLDDPSSPAVSTEITIIVMDGDSPVAMAEVPERIGNHEVLMVDGAISTDNVGVVAYNWMLYLPDGSRVSGDEAAFSHDMTGILGEARLRLTVADALGNADQKTWDIQVLDLLPPTAMVPDDMTEYEGAALRFSDEGSYDNIGIVDWSWNVTWDDGYKVLGGKSINYYFGEAGEYNITLTVTDSAGNSGSAYFIVTINDKDETFDTDGDGIPDIWEDEHGLDKYVNDATRDPDGDSLSNLQEFNLGTDPMKGDTDGDGLPDSWESQYGLDPIGTNDAQGDPDDDGDSNIKEFTEGNRDPTLADAAEEEKDTTWITVLLLVLAAIVVIVILAGVIFYFTKINSVPDDFPESEYPHLYNK